MPRKPDFYERAVKYFRKHPEEIDSAWNCFSGHRFGALFGVLARDANPARSKSSLRTLLPPFGGNEMLDSFDGRRSAPDEKILLREPHWPVVEIEKKSGLPPSEVEHPSDCAP